MKLPNREKAYIESSKVHDYLLSNVHPIGKWKARFFGAYGFEDSNEDLLGQQLMTIAHSEDIRNIISSPHGMKYIIEGTLETPVGILVKVRTVWIIDDGQDRPRFVTAYPL
ncbi:MAG: hypothetical protein NT166_29245 [Candidatus Aminicenantes bacterium]|nr:hypothetical protein [Candidatus Aminicenantes bacterium]